MRADHLVVLASNEELKKKNKKKKKKKKKHPKTHCIRGDVSQEHNSN